MVRFYTDPAPPHPGFVALRVLSTNLDPVGFVDTALPVPRTGIIATPPSTITQSSSEELPYTRVSVALPIDVEFPKQAQG